MITINKPSNEDLNSLAILFNKYRIFYGRESDLEGAKQFLKERMERDESVIFASFNEQNMMTGFMQL